MADIKLNFSSQWPSIQVAKVVESPYTAGEDAGGSIFERKIAHGLGYPPLALGFQKTTVGLDMMTGMDADNEYIYVSWLTHINLDYVVIYTLDISTARSYENFESSVGTVLVDNSASNIDLRKFLLHSRAVSPMVLAVAVEDFTLADLNMYYVSPLLYPTFQIGFVRYSDPSIAERLGKWSYAPLQSQSFPKLSSDGFTGWIQSATNAGNLVADKGCIITLRNPAIVTNNEVSIVV